MTTETWAANTAAKDAITAPVGTDTLRVLRSGASKKLSLSDLFKNYTATALSGSEADSALSISQTWNTTGTPTALKLNVTDTASDSASLLMDLQVGGVSQGKLSKGGDLTIGGTLYTGGNVDVGSNQVRTAGARLGSNFNRFTELGLTATTGTPADVCLYRDAANTLALRNSTSAQTFNIYDTYASGSDYHRVAVKTARSTLSSVSGASVTASSLIPAGAVLLGLTTKVTTGLGTTNGTTGYTIGDGSDADRWGAITGTASGTSSDNSDWTSGTIEAFTSAQDVVITATGGNFDGTGVIYVSAQYMIGECD